MVLYHQRRWRCCAAALEGAGAVAANRPPAWRTGLVFRYRSHGVRAGSARRGTGESRRRGAAARTIAAGVYQARHASHAEPSQCGGPDPRPDRWPAPPPRSPLMEPKMAAMWDQKASGRRLSTHTTPRSVELKRPSFWRVQYRKPTSVYAMATLAWPSLGRRDGRVSCRVATGAAQRVLVHASICPASEGQQIAHADMA